MNGFELIALDVNFEIVSLLRCINVQWTRRWYEAGTFSIQIPMEQYDSSMKYIYTKDRPELGEITQINFIQDDGSYMFALSGYFLEYELNRRVAYALPSQTNISNAPTWVNQSGKAEDVALAYFNAFKDVRYSRNGNNYVSELGIDSAESQGRGHIADHERDNEYLGNKIYTILKPSEMSFRVEYDFLTNKKTFIPVKGKDLTQDNTDGNNPVIFSTRFGNLKNPNVVLSYTDYKNCYVALSSYTNNNVDMVTIQANNESNTEDTADRFLYVPAGANRSDYGTEAEYIDAIHSLGHEELLSHKPMISFDFEAIQGSYRYREDFDIGDKCSIELPEMGLSVDAVLIQCAEVMKEGTWEMTMEFDVKE